MKRSEPDILPPIEARGEYELLSVSEVARYLRVSEPIVRELQRDGLLDGIAVGRRLFFTKRDIIDFITRKGGPREPAP